MVNNSIAIIPARGGSKRLPRKNILDFYGKPLIAWTIEAALKSECFKYVLVSTENEEIADISIKYGAKVPFLRKENFDDYSSSSEATYSALKQATKFWGIEFEMVAQLMANCPLRDYLDIQKSIDIFKESNYASQLSCFKLGWMNPWWAFQIKKNNEIEEIFKHKAEYRSQDLPELYCPTGAIWIAKVEQFLKEKNFRMKNYKYIPIDWVSAMDIDNEEDLLLAKALFNLRKDS